jgi:tRNA dimethylallyltransferase
MSPPPVLPSGRGQSFVCLAGPTGVGKSQVALRLAERCGGEIISVDSMQVYRGLDIGTSKPTAEERARVRHHLLDVVELNESFDAARFVLLAGEAVRQIQARQRLPILCGGTGLYFTAFLHGLGDAPSSDPKLRAELQQLPLAQLLEELAAADPATYARIDRANARRVIRAIEVIRLSGRPFSDQRAPWSPEPSGPDRAAPVRLFVLSSPMPELHRRIDVRVDDMFARGLVIETQTLLGRGLAENPTAMQALGYRQVVEHLRGERSLDETISMIKQRTHRFAKRQLTWFRHQLPVTWVDWPLQASADELAARLEQLVQEPAC